MKLIGAIVLLIIGIFIGYSFSPQIAKVMDEKTEHSDAEIQVAEINESTDTYSIKAKYPQFGMPLIDAQIKADVEDAIAELKSMPANPPESATPKNSFDGSFSNAYVGPDVISVQLVLSQYTGGAHPLSLISGVNFDRVTGRRLALEDALRMIDLTVEEVSVKVTTELQAKLGEAFFPEGATTNPENFSSFSISKDTVTFIFQQYQVGPYAAGPQEVSFERKR